MTRILVIDDDRLFRRSVSRMLRREGYQVMEAGTAVEAIPLIELHPLDLVITDWRIPMGDGFEVLRALRHARPDTPGIMVSAYAGPQEIDHALRLGASEVLIKPVSADRIRSAVLGALFRRNTPPRVKWLE